MLHIGVDVTPPLAIHDLSYDPPALRYPLPTERSGHM